MLSLIESLRLCKRSDLPTQLVKLHRLLTSVARVPGLSRRVCSELEDTLDVIGDHLQELYDSFVAAGLTDSLPLPVLQVRSSWALWRGFWA